MIMFRQVLLVTLFSCPPSVVTEDIEVPLFTGRSYLKFDRRNILKRYATKRAQN